MREARMADGLERQVADLREAVEGLLCREVWLIDACNALLEDWARRDGDELAALRRFEEGEAG